MVPLADQNVSDRTDGLQRAKDESIMPIVEKQWREMIEKPHHNGDSQEKRHTQNFIGQLVHQFLLLVGVSPIAMAFSEPCSTSSMLLRR